MKWVTGLIKVLGGISFGAVLLLIYVIAPLGLLALILNQPLSQFTPSLPATASGTIYSGGFTAIVVGLLAIIFYGLVALFKR